MAGFRLVDTIKPILAIIPEVELPYEKVTFDDKVVYTLIASLIYLFGQFPLAGVSAEAGAVKDPLFFLRGVFAAEPRTLMEFGLFPPIATALILQLLAGLRVIRVNFKQRQDRELFQSLIKVLSVVQYAILANVFIFSGYYGDNLPLSAIVFLNMQLIGAGLFTTLLVEVIDKGFGFGSGCMSIVTVATATNLVTDTLGLNQKVINGAEGITEPHGALVNLITGLWAQHKTFLGSIVNAFQRDYLPNLTTVVIVFALAILVCYLQNYRVELPVRSTKARGMNNMYPIRLMYTAGLSILFSYTLLFYIHVAAFAIIQLVGKNDPSSSITKLLGGYTISGSLHYTPNFPLSLLAPPRSLLEGFTRQPLTIVVFPLFLAMTGTWFAKRWQDISGSSARDLGNQFKEQGITLVGRREQSVSKELDKVIPVATATGATILAIVVSVGEFLGLKGAAASIVVGVLSAFSLLEIISMDFQQCGGQSTLAQVFAGSGSF
ncbi:AFR613Cp [Eremothecium gossypii ATCC 10895]|uniref:AFR613Cp n=1 Tax=Eremothecium gossypii (strain ATCC 10895 / CBS 109.51 / FGSC 9923 / NRRL Y-1056) TaxID=284811 RepID=Q752G3_EREGS|nr:AFR613Cp [Eremothecium gossypii ATCC 10895]AAS53984.1 AFR613Cp [Eremothecium gossypii ATCC 10895]AEY98298.1 FAFR613Cp [Eremothecium gossypii FDAG1]